MLAYIAQAIIYQTKEKGDKILRGHGSLSFR
jgi:hypothetical protein